MNRDGDHENPMVYTTCTEWLQDWVAASKPTLHDEWDLQTWMDEEMHAATRVFLTYAFHTPRARNDAIMVLRALYYEYFLFEQQRAIKALMPNPRAASILPHMPQSVQKSAEWHAESRDVLSGHEFGALVAGAPAARLAALLKKCAPPVDMTTAPTTDSQHVFLTPAEGSLSPFKWGWRFEPVARDLFATVYAGGVENVFDGLGRIKHPLLPRLGASPDGLITAGHRAGRLVELKCPITRQLNGSIPMDYWCQMQLQAEVCDVDAVEYFEVSFGSALGPLTIDLMSTLGTAPCATMPYIGVVAVIAPSADAPWTSYTYQYSPLIPACPEGVTTARDWTPTLSDGAVVLETAYWWVKDAFHKTVLRNPRWWAAVGHPTYEAFWAEVDAARADGRFASHYETQLLVLDDEADLEPLVGSAGAPAEEGDVEDTDGAQGTVGVWIGVEDS
jgi:hypothetical protein